MALLGFCIIHSKNGGNKKKHLIAHFLKTFSCFHEGNDKETEIDMYMNIYKIYQDLSCRIWAKTESSLVISEVSI